MSLFRHHGYLAGCFSYVQDWPKTRLTKTNVKTDKSYSLVFYDMFICLRTIKYLSHMISRNAHLFFDIHKVLRSSEVIAGQPEVSHLTSHLSEHV